jgi:type II secretory pathway component PulM
MQARAAVPMRSPNDASFNNVVTASANACGLSATMMCSFRAAAMPVAAPSEATTGRAIAIASNTLF